MMQKFAVKQFWIRFYDGYWPWVETVIVTVAILALCRLTNPNNPLFLHAIFPWPWLASVVIVLKYGFMPGVATVGLITLATFLQSPPNSLTNFSYQSYLLSGFTLTFLCALFSASWSRRVMHAEELQAYTDERLGNLSRAYYMLHVSYNFLEQNLITKPVTLRMMLVELQQLLVGQEGEITQDIAQRLMQMICQFCAVTTVGMYVMHHKTLSTQPLAEIGAMGELILNDPLVRYAKKADEVGYVSIHQLTEIEQSEYLVVAPMRTDDNELLGIIVIKEMSFWSLTQETLRILEILVIYFVEEIMLARGIVEFLPIYPDIPPEFVRQFKKLLALTRGLNLNSSFTAVLVDTSLRPQNVIANLTNIRRSLDSLWRLQLGNYDVLITLMPLTDATGVQGYMHRVTNYLKSDLGLEIDQVRIKTRAMQLYATKPLVMLQQFMDYLKDAADVK